MTDLDHGAVCAELDAILASARCGAPAITYNLPGQSNTVGRSVSGAAVRPNIVADASVQNADIHQGNKAPGTTSAITGQYAETPPHTHPFPSLPTTIPVHITSTTPPPLPPVLTSMENARARPGGSQRVSMAHLLPPTINQIASRGAQLPSSTKWRLRKPGTAPSADSVVTG